MTTPDLKAAALAATKGEWRFSRDKACVICDTKIVWNGQVHAIRQTVATAPIHDNRINDMSYLVAANPATILALIAELEDTKRKLARWKDCSGVQDA